MRATSWYATGLVELAWKRLGVTNGRDELARLTGISPSNLSSYNRGKRPMTPEKASKIAVATGASLAELGQPPSPQELQRQIDRLAALEEGAERSREAGIEALASIDARLSRIEAALGLPDVRPSQISS